VRLRFAPGEPGRGLVGWALRGLAGAEIDGLPDPGSSDAPDTPGEHANGVRRIDHVVAFSPQLDRTVAALERAGLELRRLREGPTPGGSDRQAFFRLGEPVLEVIEAPEGSRLASDPDGPPRLWGLALLTEDLAATARVLGDRLGEPRDAVQPGRQIATLRPTAGLGPAVAFMSP
jgi:hypothetical protein